MTGLAHKGSEASDQLAASAGRVSSMLVGLCDVAAARAIIDLSPGFQLSARERGVRWPTNSPAVRSDAQKRGGAAQLAAGIQWMAEIGDCLAM